MGLTEPRRACPAAPTHLERLFWHAVVLGNWEPYLAELAITDLRGPGHLPDDFDGCEDENNHM